MSKVVVIVCNFYAVVAKSLKAQLIRETKVSSACWESDDFSKAGVEEVAEVQPKLMGAHTRSILNAHIYQAVAG